MSSTQISAAATSPPKPTRPTANFLPTIWGNQFLKDDFEFKFHQKQLSEILRWCKTSGFTKNLPYIRDRTTEIYFWILGICFEPKYAYARRKLTEVFALQALIDDTYDSYGTLEELTPFTEAIRRWDIAAIDALPDYMKFIYTTVFNILGAIEEDTIREGRPYSITYPKKLVQSAVEANYTEAVWFNRGYVPSFEEYMNAAMETGSCRLLMSIAFIALCAREEDFEWLCSDQKILIAANLMARLFNDIASHRFEQKRGNIPSAVECYMKQHGVSEKETIRVLLEQVADAWKDVNEAMLKPTAVSMPLLGRILNLCRTLEFIYGILVILMASLILLKLETKLSYCSETQYFEDYLLLLELK